MKVLLRDLKLPATEPGNLIKPDPKNMRGWLQDLLKELPYDHKLSNMVIDPSLMTENFDMVQQKFNDPEFYETCKTPSLENMSEKVYAFACFLPQGKFNSCVLYNCLLYTSDAADE